MDPKRFLKERLKWEVIPAVVEGDEVRVRNVLARGGDPKVIVATKLGASWCLVALAVHLGHAHLLPCLLEAGLSVEGGCSDGRTPLMLAAAGGHEETVEKLLELGANPLAADPAGWTALHWAALRGHAECVSTLIPVNPPTPKVLQASHAHTPVHLASFGGHVAVLKALAGAGWPLYTRDMDGLTPLHWAVKAGRLAVVKYVLDKKETPSLHSGDQRAPLDSAEQQARDLAVRWLSRRSGAAPVDAAKSLQPEAPSSAGGNTTAADHALRPQDLWKLLGFREWLVVAVNKQEVITAVVEGDEVRVRDVLARGGDPNVIVATKLGASWCLVALAAHHGHAHLLPCLLAAGLSVEGDCSDSLTPLMLAAAEGHKETVEKLLCLGANSLAADPAEWTALHWAALWGHAECVSTLIPVTPPTPQVLQAFHAHTPVHLASFGGHVAVLKALAGAGWSLYTRDMDGLTPLDWAVKAGRLAVVKYMLEKKATPSLLGWFPRMRLKFAEQQARDLAVGCLSRRSGAAPVDAAQSLQPEAPSSAGGNTTAADHAVRPQDLWKLLGFRGWLVVTVNKQEVITAVVEGDEVRVRDVLARGGDPKVTVATVVGESWCLVALAAHHGHAHLLPCLLAAGLSVEGGCSDGRTPLMAAAAEDHEETVEKLLELGANPMAADPAGWTALHWAAWLGRARCVEKLIGVTEPTTKDKGGCTPVHHAALGGCLEVVKTLAKKNVSPLLWKDKDGNTPLDRATMAGRHEVEAWLAKRSGTVHWDAARCLRLMRVRRRVDEENHSNTVSSIVKGNTRILKKISKYNDGHMMDAGGLTPLHHAAERGQFPECVRTLLQESVNPHVLTPDGLTPTDLARGAGHQRLLTMLAQHGCEQLSSSPAELHDELLSIITSGDDWKKVSRLLCQGAPIEPVVSGATSPLRLAVILDRCRTVTLLLAHGAVLPASLLQDAWQSPDVTSGVLATLTAAYLCRLRAERRRAEERGLASKSGEQRRRVDALVEGIDKLLETIDGDTPWKAEWPTAEPLELSALMAEAVRTKCPLSVAFLHRAGAWSFRSGEWGASALAAALEEDHKGMTDLFIKHLGSSVYADARLLSRGINTSLKENQYQKELNTLEYLMLRQKSERGKKAARLALRLQRELHASSVVGRPYGRLKRGDGRSVLQLSTRKGLAQLTHLVVQVGRFPVDETLDDICGTTALHEAAAHGKDSCVALLLGLGADPLRRDRCSQTPRLLAAMFGHKNTEQLLALHEPYDPPCRAGTTAKQTCRHYDAYLRRYAKVGSEERDSLTPVDRQDPERVTCKLMGAIGVEELWQRANEVSVDFSSGEDLQVKDAVMKELRSITEKVAQEDSLYDGELKLVGSSGDGSKIYCPDEFDVNLVIKPKKVDVQVEENPEELKPSKGKFQLLVKAEEVGLEGNRLMDNLFTLLQMCLAEHTLQDKRLCFVPPGLTSTQFGAGLSLAWQGEKYPLLLVGVDLVPVLELPLHDKIKVPKLIKDEAKTFHVSNNADGSWRCSFALTEANVLRKLCPVRRRVFIMGKVLLSCLKTEPWMPQDLKHSTTWFVDRPWNISVPRGFCFKNAFLRRLEVLGGKQDVTGQEEAEYCTKELIAIFREMCDDKEKKRGHLSSAAIAAYFGGDFEGKKAGEGAHLIVRCLEENLEERGTSVKV